MSRPPQRGNPTANASLRRDLLVGAQTARRSRVKPGNMARPVTGGADRSGDTAVDRRLHARRMAQAGRGSPRVRSAVTESTAGGPQRSPSWPAGCSHKPACVPQTGTPRRRLDNETLVRCRWPLRAPLLPASHNWASVPLSWAPGPEGIGGCGSAPGLRAHPLSRRATRSQSQRIETLVRRPTPWLRTRRLSRRATRSHPQRIETPVRRPTLTPSPARRHRRVHSPADREILPQRPLMDAGLPLASR
jgi:hypothetical protein